MHVYNSLLYHSNENQICVYSISTPPQTTPSQIYLNIYSVLSLSDHLSLQENPSGLHNSILSHSVFNYNFFFPCFFFFSLHIRQFPQIYRYLKVFIDIPFHVYYLSLIIAEHRSAHSSLLLLNTQPIKLLGSFMRNIRSLRSLKSSSLGARRDSQLRGLSRLPLTLIQPSSRSIRLLTPLCSTFTNRQGISYITLLSLNRTMDAAYRFSLSSQTPAALNHGLCPMEMHLAEGTKAFSSPY